MKTEILLPTIVLTSFMLVLIINWGFISNLLFGNKSAIPNELKSFR